MADVAVRAAGVYLEAEVSGNPARRLAGVYLEAEVSGNPARRLAGVYLEAEVQLIVAAGTARSFVVIAG